MTPAVETAREAGIFFEIHPYEHATNSHSYGLEAAEKLGLPPQRVFKTLVVDLAGHGLCVGLIPVSNQLNMKLIAQAGGRNAPRWPLWRRLYEALGMSWEGSARSDKSA